MNLKEMRARMSALSPELETLAKKDERSAEDEARLDAILTEINDLGPKIEREANVQRAADAARSMREPAGAVAAREHAADGAEEQAQVDTRSAIAQFLDSDEYKRAMESGRKIVEPVKVRSLHRRSRMAMQFGEQAVSSQEARALMTSGTPSASFLLPDVLPTIYRARDIDLRMRDVLVNGQTQSDAITVLQENVFTNSAAEVAESAAVDGTGLTGGVKPESGITFTEATFPVRTIAHWVPITRQLLADLAFMRSYIEDRLRVGIERREDGQILNGNGTTPNLRGILNTSGIQVLDDTYFTGAPVLNAGTQVENFNRLRRAKRMIRITGGATPTFFVLNPEDLEELETAGDANKVYYGPGPFTNGDIPRIWGLPVVESENIAAGTALAGDGMMAAVVDREDTQIYTTDSHSDFFIRNILVILAEERIALPVFRPVAFAKVTLADAA